MAQAEAAGGEGSPAPDEDDTASYLEHCQQRFSIPGLVEFSAGFGGLPKATLCHTNGSQAEVYLHGANVASWADHAGHELLHLREDNTFDGSKPLSGGVSVAWPQYGAGPLPTHGFLRHLHWSVVETSAADGGAGEDPRPNISLYAETDPAWAGRWPHEFQAVYTVCLCEPDELEDDPARIAAAIEGGRVAPMESGFEGGGAGAGPAPSGSGRGRGRAFQPYPSRQQQQQQQQQQAQVKQGFDDDSTVDPPRAAQLRCLLHIHNSGESAFTFTTALQTHFATEDIPSHAKAVKALGLWGKYMLDYAKSPLLPRLDIEQEDFQFFGGGEQARGGGAGGGAQRGAGARGRGRLRRWRRGRAPPRGHTVCRCLSLPLPPPLLPSSRPAQIDRIYVDCDAKGDVKFCPGSLQSHFEVENAQGFTDIGIVHPGASHPAEAARFVSLPSARVARPVTLQPGETWCGEMRLTAHNRYWQLPPWEEQDQSTIPLPPASEALPSAKLGGHSKSHELRGYELRSRG
eukprot:scaffold4.g5038.t1